MEYTKTPAGIMIPKSNEFDLMQTLDCGQSFRWEPCNEKSNRIGGIAFGRYLELEESDKHILFCDTEEDDFLHIWVPYFDLELDYKSIKDDLSELDPILCKAAQYAPGIRILQQDPWEALCCFIISQNNNIPRIKGIVSRLCEHFGEKIPGGFAFPAPEVLANCTVEDLAPLRSGFRAKYILNAAQKVAQGIIILDAMKTMPLEEVRQQLMTIQGVGPKVAECAALYGLHRLEAFPMDVWMKRAMAILFPNKTAADFGRYAGIAQQNRNSFLNNVMFNKVFWCVIINL